MKHHRRKHRDRVSHDRWLVSYADFITLLFAFFVVLYSAAEVDRHKVGQVSAAIQEAFQKLGPFPAASSQNPLLSSNAPTAPTVPSATKAELADLSSLQHELERALAPEISRGEVAVRGGPDGLVVSLREMGFFDSGSADIKAHSQAAFRRLAEILARTQFQLRIEGHTDNVPIRNPRFNSNWELSTGRATEVVKALITVYAVAPDRLSAAGYAEYHPAASNDTDQGRAQNRRVDVVILNRQPVTNTPQAIQQ